MTGRSERCGLSAQNKSSSRLMFIPQCGASSSAINMNWIVNRTRPSPNQVNEAVSIQLRPPRLINGYVLLRAISRLGCPRVTRESSLRHHLPSPSSRSNTVRSSLINTTVRRGNWSVGTVCAVTRAGYMRRGKLITI